MSRRLLVINVALGIVSVVLAVGVFRTLLAKQPLPPPPAPRAVSAAAPAAPVAAGDAGPGTYGVIAARNLFNPSRSETVAVAVAAAVAAPVAKPILLGVVIDGAKRRAFLEDPALKRVAGYSVGDTVGGGTIQKIADDRVVIVRPEGPIEILLQDPAKPRAAPTAAAAPARAGSPPTQVPPAVPQVRRGIPPGGQPVE